MSKKKTATVDSLEELHGALAEAFKEQIALIKRAAKGDLEVKGAAATLNVIRQFLKDNGVEAEPAKGSPLGNLVGDLPFDVDESSASRH